MRRTLAAFAAAVAMLGPAALTIASATTASASVTATATTKLQAHPDSGYNSGNWANDTLTRVATVTLTGPDATLSDCGAGATSCYIYTGTIKDTGTFVAITGATSPGAKDTPITGSPTGSVNGGTSVTFYASSNTPSAARVPANVDGPVSGEQTTTNWVEQFFPSGTTFGAGPSLPNWSWTYKSSTCETWTDAYNLTGPTSGDITGVNQCKSAVGRISNFYSHKCLDVRNGNYAANSGVLQQWTCGANGGANQKFQLAHVGGIQVLEAIGPDGQPWCVTTGQVAGTSRLALEDCTGSDQVVAKIGPFYKFSDGNVMDDSGYSKVNGTYVIEHAKNNPATANQEWSLP